LVFEAIFGIFPILLKESHGFLFLPLMGTGQPVTHTKLNPNFIATIVVYFLSGIIPLNKFYFNINRTFFTTFAFYI